MTSLWTRPGTLAFQDLTSDGSVSVSRGYRGNGGGSDVVLPVHTVVSANLTLVPPCELRMEDLVTLNITAGPNEGGGNSYLERPIDAGDEWVWHDVGSVGGSSPHQCSTITTYTIDRFVKKSDLGHYGARDFKLGEPRQVCAP